MVRKIKDSVGICQVCKSSAVLSQSRHYSDKKLRWSVVCSNPNCGKRTGGFLKQESAILSWNDSWGKAINSGRNP